jgi:hypothetical protein
VVLPISATSPKTVWDRLEMQERERAGQLEPLHALEVGEELHERLATDSYTLDVTNRRLLLTRGRPIAMDLPIDGLPRIQFDVERNARRRSSSCPSTPAKGRRYWMYPMASCPAPHGS